MRIENFSLCEFDETHFSRCRNGRLPVLVEYIQVPGFG